MSKTNIKAPNQFLKKLLYSNEVPLSTEDIEIGLITGGRTIAPFIRKNGEAIMVGGLSGSYQTVAAPNIRLKRPFTPSDLLFGRQPGTVIFSPGDDYQLTALQQHIARDLQYVENMIVNAEEYLSAMALQGAISYEVADQEVFSITFPRSSDNNVTPTIFWDAADPTTVNLPEYFYTAKKLLADSEGLGVTDAIFGSEAAAAFRKLAATGKIPTLDIRNISAGQVTFLEQFRDDGVLYMGNYNGVNLWEYSRTADLNGTPTSLIRPKYVEFISTSPASERVMYYGAIPDMDAIEGRKFQGKRFSKSWKENDPSVQMFLVHSRPLPVPRKPNATVSMKVVSG